MAFLPKASGIGLVEILSLIAAVIAARLVYFAFLHPLSIYPGPPVAAQTYLWYAAALFSLSYSSLSSSKYCSEHL